MMTHRVKCRCVAAIPKTHVSIPHLERQRPEPYSFDRRGALFVPRIDAHDNKPGGESHKECNPQAYNLEQDSETRWRHTP
jgi:hypothetical protein